MSIFSERLKQLRIENKLNQADVAAVIGVSVQATQHMKLPANRNMIFYVNLHTTFLVRQTTY